jgi:hypothetical protein
MIKRTWDGAELLMLNANELPRPFTLTVAFFTEDR